MKYRFFNLETGLVLPGFMELPDLQAVADNTPEGYCVTLLDVDPATQRIDPQTRQAVPYEPPERPIELVEEEARWRRDALLAASDWITLRALDTGEPVPLAWRQYRQFLRDAPQQSGWPRDVEWPEVPIDT